MQSKSARKTRITRSYNNHIRCIHNTLRYRSVNNLFNREKNCYEEKTVDPENSRCISFTDTRRYVVLKRRLSSKRENVMNKIKELFEKADSKNFDRLVLPRIVTNSKTVGFIKSFIKSRKPIRSGRYGPCTFVSIQNSSDSYPFNKAILSVLSQVKIR